MEVGYRSHPAPTLVNSMRIEVGYQLLGYSERYEGLARAAPPLKSRVPQNPMLCVIKRD